MAIIDRRGIAVNGSSPSAADMPDVALAIKLAVRAASIVNMTLAGLQTVDGVFLGAGNRVLVKNQTDPTQNGIYVVSSGNWPRAVDFDASAEIASGVVVMVAAGTISAQKMYQLTAWDPIVLGASNLTFVMVSGTQGPSGEQGEPGESGAAGPAAWLPPVAWLTATAYVVGPPASSVTQDGETYVCLIPHTSGVFVADLAATRWIKVAAKGAAGAGQVSSVNGQIGDVLLSGRNVLINPKFAIDQRYLGVEATIVDNAYWADRWRYIGEASAACKAKDSTLGGGVLDGYIKFTGTTNKGGVFQVVEGSNCKHLRGGSVSLSAVLSVSNVRLSNIKMGIAQFTGTEDATAGDPISSWGADGTTPTLAANWAFINTPANLSVATSSVRYSVTGTIGSSANNLAALIWNDDKTYSANDILYVTDAQLEAGAVATPIERRLYAIEQTMCNRYMRSIGGNTNGRYGAARTTSTVNGELIMYLVVPMHHAPTVTVNNVTNWRVNDANVAAAATSLVGSLTAADTVNVNLAIATVTANRPAFFDTINTNATMWFEAEI